MPKWSDFHTIKKKKKCNNPTTEAQGDRQPTYIEKLELLRKQELSYEEDEQFKKHILSDLKNGKNIMLHGMGGTGKTFLINRFIDYCKTVGRNVAVIAPTGLASTNYENATTIHNFLKLKPDVYVDYQPEMEQIMGLLHVDTVIVDELSMVRCDLFDLLERSIRCAEEKKGTAIQRIYCGDVMQLAPVATKEEQQKLDEAYESSCYMFFDSHLFDSIALKHFLLQKNRRTEANQEEYAAMLSLIHDGDTSALEFFNDGYRETDTMHGDDLIVLASHRKTVDQINASHITLHEGDKTFCYMDAQQTEGKKQEDYPVNFSIPVFEGMKIMTVANSKKAGYMNGTIGTVERIEADKLHVKTTQGQMIVVEREKITSFSNEAEYINQFAIAPAYSISIHKAQGLSLDKALVYPNCFAAGQLYTALSRLRSKNGLYLVAPIPDAALIVNEAAKEFLCSITMITARNYRDNKDTDTQSDF